MRYRRSGKQLITSSVFEHFGTTLAMKLLNDLCQDTHREIQINKLQINFKLYSGNKIQDSHNIIIMFQKKIKHQNYKI